MTRSDFLSSFASTAVLCKRMAILLKASGWIIKSWHSKASRCAEWDSPLQVTHDKAWQQPNPPCLLLFLLYYVLLQFIKLSFYLPSTRSIMSKSLVLRYLCIFHSQFLRFIGSSLLKKFITCIHLPFIPDF